MSGILGICGVGWYSRVDIVAEVETVVDVVDVEVDKVVELSLSTLAIRKEWLVVDTSPPRWEYQQLKQVEQLDPGS